MVPIPIERENGSEIWKIGAYAPNKIVWRWKMKMVTVWTLVFKTTSLYFLNDGPECRRASRPPDADHVVPVQLDRLIQNAVRGVLSSRPGDRHLRYLVREIAGRETLAAQQLPLSPLSPISILVISRESNLTPLSAPGWARAKKRVSKICQKA
jgi:hypothetical protein